VSDSKVKPEDFGKELGLILDDFSDEVFEKTKKAVDTVTKEMADEIKSKIPFKQRTKKYVKAFKTKTSYEDKRNKRNTWYVSGKQYRLTHLLERSHKNQNGTYSKAFPHVIYGEELAQRRLPEEIKKEIEEG